MWRHCHPLWRLVMRKLSTAVDSRAGSCKYADCLRRGQ